MRTIIFMIVVLLLIVGCGEKVTKVTVEDSNEDSVYHIAPGDGLLGNVDLYIMPETMQGSSVLLINGPGNPIGYQIRKDDIIYCQDSYIGSGGYTFQSGTSLPFNTWVKVNLVVYKSTFAGWLWPVGDLWEALDDLIVDTTYEIEVKIVFKDGIPKILVRESEDTLVLQAEPISGQNNLHQVIIKNRLTVLDCKRIIFNNLKIPH